MLVECNECKAQISNAATACPTCGHPQTTRIEMTACPQCQKSIGAKWVSCPHCGFSRQGKLPAGVTPAGLIAVAVIGVIAVALFALSGKEGNSPTAAVPDQVPPPAGTVQGDVRILGLGLGQPFDIPTCETNAEHDVLVSALKAMCKMPVPGDLYGNYWFVYLPPSETPSYVDQIKILVLDYHVEEIQVATKGVPTQDAAMADLTEKFGAPAHQNTNPKSNAFGATFDVVEASWAIAGGGAIFFAGATDRIDHGQINLVTDKAWKWSPPAQPSAHL